MTSFVHCRGCGHEIHETAPTCPKCGAPQNIGNTNGAIAQPIGENKAARNAKATKSAERQSLDIEYSEVPFYRRRWFYLITALFFVPLTALIAMTGPLYYQEKGEVKKFPTSARVTFAIIGVLSLVLVLLRGVIMIGGLGVQGHACADDATTGLVKEIFLKDVATGIAIMGSEADVSAIIKALEIKISGVRTNGSVKGKSKLSCTANMEITIPASAIKAVNSQSLKQAAALDNQFRSMAIEGNIARDQIQYTTQLADNRKEFYVELDGSDGLLGVVGLIAFWEIQYKREERENPAAITTSNTSPLPATEPVVTPSAPSTVSVPAVNPTQTNVETRPSGGVGQDEKDSPPIVANLCTSSETVLFACTTGKKLISICGTKNLSANSGQIFYRLAPVGQAPEMTYPDGNQQPKVAFKQGSFNVTREKLGHFISFNRGDFRYVFYNGDSNVHSYSGVYVERAGKRIANLRCEGDVNDNLDVGMLAKIGVVEDATAFSEQ